MGSERLKFAVVLGDFKKFIEILDSKNRENIAASDNIMEDDNHIPYNDSDKKYYTEFTDATRLLNSNDLLDDKLKEKLAFAHGLIFLCDDPSAYQHNQLNTRFVQILAKVVPVYFVIMERDNIPKLSSPGLDKNLLNINHSGTASNCIVLSDCKQKADFIDLLIAGLQKEAEIIGRNFQWFIEANIPTRNKEVADTIAFEIDNYSHTDNNLIMPTPQAKSYNITEAVSTILFGEAGDTAYQLNEIGINNKLLKQQPKVIIGGTIMNALKFSLSADAWLSSKSIMEEDSDDYFSDKNKATGRLLYNIVAYNGELAGVYGGTKYHYIAKDEIVYKVVEKVKEMHSLNNLSKETNKQYRFIDPSSGIADLLIPKVFMVEVTLEGLQYIIDEGLKDISIEKKIKAICLNRTEIVNACEASKNKYKTIAESIAESKAAKRAAKGK